MTASKTTTSSSDIPYNSLPTHPRNVVVLTYYNPPNPFPLYLRRCLVFTLSLLLLSLAIYFLYPSDPTLQVARLKLNHVNLNLSYPSPTLDLSFSLLLKVYNKDLFSLDYNSLLVSVGYRGRVLGFVNSDGGKVRPRGFSYVNATLDLNGLEVVHDVFYLIEDLARGVIPFDTVTTVDGILGLFFFEVPIKVKISCEVYVNTNNQTVVRQDCYPERTSYLKVGLVDALLKYEPLPQTQAVLNILQLNTISVTVTCAHLSDTVILSESRKPFGVEKARSCVVSMK